MGLHTSLTYQTSPGYHPSMGGFELAEGSRNWAKDDNNNNYSQHILSVRIIYLRASQLLVTFGRALVGRGQKRIF